jgi:cell division protein ZapE
VSQVKYENPEASYRAAINDGLLQPDDKQSEIVKALQKLHESIMAEPASEAAAQKPAGFFARLFSSEERSPQASGVKGLYLWGGVGRGKTLLCDMFFNTLPIEKKSRIHFHRFMQGVHDKLRSIKGEQSPLEIVAADYAKQYRVLVLDEMHINDITDAMLMSGLLRGLFSRGVVIVTTSNVRPDDLYKDGLQRAQFLPAIDALNEFTEVIYLGGDTDYRLRALENAEIYHVPLDDAADAVLDDYFRKAVAAGEVRSDNSVEINQRQIDVYKLAENVVWFQFDALCMTNRSTDDYIEIARQFDTVLVANIPTMDGSNTDVARRFINMIDEFYDRKVKLVATAAALPESLYEGTRLSFEFERTASRLREMQSVEYLASKHQP